MFIEIENKNNNEYEMVWLEDRMKVLVVVNNFFTRILDTLVIMSKGARGYVIQSITTKVAGGLDWIYRESRVDCNGRLG